MKHWKTLGMESSITYLLQNGIMQPHNLCLVDWKRKTSSDIQHETHFDNLTKRRPFWFMTQFQGQEGVKICTPNIFLNFLRTQNICRTDNGEVGWCCGSTNCKKWIILLSKKEKQQSLPDVGFGLCLWWRCRYLDIVIPDWLRAQNFPPMINGTSVER